MLANIIETPRLRLRPFGIHDVDAVLRYATDPEWARYLPVPQPYRKENAEQFVARQILSDRERHPSWGIEVSGTLSGGINIRFDFENRLGEIGYSIARQYWGKGLATEAARTVIDAAFSAHGDLARVHARADARNVGSLRVMEKIGMVHEGTLRQNRILRGGSIDEAWWGILRTEWEAGRG